jgi:uncharacterized protein YjbI with pentapeptide repeats
MPTLPKPPRLARALPELSSDAGSLVAHALVNETRITDLDLEDQTFEGTRFDSVCFSHTKLARATLNAVSLLDSAISQADLANLTCRRSTLTRTRIESARLTGSRWSECVLQDIHVRACRADLSSWRFSKLDRVLFEECDLDEADFSSAAFADVAFSSCSLRGATFTQASMQRTAFTTCKFTQIHGASGLAGATLEPDAIIGLAPSLAHALGILER